MGPPLAPLLADLCINWIIDQTKQIRPEPSLFYKYLDDYFVLFSSQKEILKFYQQLNMIHPNIQFTYEAAENLQMQRFSIGGANFSSLAIDISDVNTKNVTSNNARGAKMIFPSGQCAGFKMY